MRRWTKTTATTRSVPWPHRSSRPPRPRTEPGVGLLVFSDGGTRVRTRGSKISPVEGKTRGVTLSRLAADESLPAIGCGDASLDEDDGDDEVGTVAAPEQQAPPPAG